MDATLIFFVAGFFLFCGVLASKISTVLRIPALLVFLAVGMFAGSEGVGKIVYEHFESANFIGSLALAFILFSGGYDASWKAAKRVLFRGTLLASLGVLLTAAILGAIVHFAFGVELDKAFLLGAIVSSTDAAAVFAIFKSRGSGLKGNLRTVLEFESGSNDPMAAFLTLFMISRVLEGGSSWEYLTIIPTFAIKMGVGVGGGFLIAKGIVWLFQRLRLEYEGLYYVLGIATVFLLYSVTEYCGGNGFMAAYVGGLTMGNSRFVYRRGLARFNDGIAWLMQLTVFLLLGLLVNPSELYANAGKDLFICAALMFVARPLAVATCLLGSRWTLKEQIAIDWGGFRGAAPIVLATFPALAGVDGAKDVFNSVFFIVLVSIAIQGKTFPTLTRLLGLAKNERERARAPLEFEETGDCNGQMFEFAMTKDAAAVGKTLAELQFPTGALVLLIRRDNKFIVPNGETVVSSRDDLIVFFDPLAHSDVERILTEKIEKADKTESAPPQ